MSNKPENDDREFGPSDRERQRMVSTEGARSASPSGTDTKPRAGTPGQAPQRQRSNRGFASMDLSKQREIASKGGKAAHAKGTAHEFDSGEAREAGRKGGLAVSQNREHMAQIGRRGGEARGAGRARTPDQSDMDSATPSTEEGAATNRSASTITDREVDLRESAKGSSGSGVTTNPQGARGGNASLGGERRPNSVLDESRESFGNH